MLVPNPVPGVGQFRRAEVGQFCVSPKNTEFKNQRTSALLVRDQEVGGSNLTTQIDRFEVTQNSSSDEAYPPNGLASYRSRRLGSPNRRHRFRCFCGSQLLP